MKKRKEIQNKKRNARLYPIYKMMSWDLLFYFSIIYLFLTQAKGFTASQVLLSDAFFTASCLILQFPMGLLVDKFGKKNSVVFANICLCVFNIIIIFLDSYYQLLIAYFIYAIGYVIKGVCETNILYDSLPRGKRRGGLYSTIDGIGTSRFYIIDAITGLLAGFAFVVNPYLPIVLCLIGNICATILATMFKHTHITDKENEEKIDKKEYFKQLKEAMQFCISSKRMRYLLLFYALVLGLLYNMTTFRSGVLEQVGLPEQYFGVVFAGTQILASICSRTQNIIHNKFRNRTLSFLGIPLTLSCVLIGIFAMGNVILPEVIIIAILFMMQGAIKGTFNVLIYRYLNNFTNKQVRTKLATLRNIIYNISAICISLFGAFLLDFTSAGNAILIIGFITTTIMTILLKIMKHEVGLKPEQYSEEDLKYSSLGK